MIRPPHPDEGERLREIAIAAKAHWGYPVEQVQDWAGQGDFSAAGLEAKEFFVAEEDGRAVAFASLICRGAVCVLDDLWVEPDAMGKGIGSALFRAAAERARTLGSRTLEWEAEPHAVGFYERMGGRYLRDSPLSPWGRVLPVMGVDL
ncbi:MAG TPA: GNAT family N-acetyltransferase [Gaiellaceae bacterium]|nr:GNAT family N-acetyltransferase [Gaiellaceae bacterium]